MNRAPSPEELDRFEGGTDGLSDEEVAERVRALDAMLRVR